MALNQIGVGEDCEALRNGEIKGSLTDEINRESEGDCEVSGLS